MLFIISRDEPLNPEIFTLKGQNALGTDFYAVFQTHASNVYFDPTLPIYGPGHNTTVEPFTSAIDIVAVDPGTTQVWVYPTNPIEGWGQPDSFMVSLQYGQTISLLPQGYHSAGAASVAAASPARRLTGTRIKTRNGKRVAVTLKDDSVLGDTGCWDLIGDQTVPISAVHNDGTVKPILRFRLYCYERQPKRG